ncbi:MAG: ADOP family duplicated permease [Vicinamibacterales bacterium]
MCALRLGRFFRRRFWDEERARELEAYLTHEIDDNVARGLTRDEARDAAVRKLGNATLVREEIYTMNTIGWLDAAWRDLRYGARVLVRNPAFALVTILSLALGIGANTAIFQLIDAIELRTLPVVAPQQLVEVRPEQLSRWGSATGRRSIATAAIYEAIAGAQHTFSGVLAWGTGRFDLSSSGESRLVAGLWLSGNFFNLLGVTPHAGRLLAPGDDIKGCGSPVAVISYPFWQREYGGSATAVGSTIHLNRHPLDIVGIAPAGFSGVEVGRSFDVAVPICAEPILEPDQDAVDKRHYWWLDVIGRLRPGVSVERANADLAAISAPVFQASLAPQFPPEYAKKFLAMKLRGLPAATGASSLRGAYQQPLWILLAVAGIVLMIACANLVSLMLARATAREREIAVRLAIGASRGRIVRQMLAESALIAAVGALLGVFVAQSLSRFLVAFISTGSDRVFFDLGSDWRVAAFTSGMAIMACLLFGLTPAVRATRDSAAAAMKAGGRGSTDSRERFGLRRLLVACQVALSIVLLVGGLLFVRTARNLAEVDPGFRARDLLIADFDPRGAKVPPANQPQFERDLRNRIAALPGVESAADAAIEPLTGSIWNDRVIIGGVSQQTIADENYVSPGFFKTLGMPILAGRDFTERDLPGTPWVSIVNESFGEKYFGRARPIGKTYRLEVSPGEPNPTYEIVGVVANTKYGDVRDSFGPVAYYPEAQVPTPDAFLSEVQVFVRSRLPMSTLAPSITRAAHDQNASILVSYRVFATDIAASFLPERLMATVSGFFAALAGVLATIGLYGVMAYMVARRRKEIGIRMALGAEAGRVLRMVLREAGILLAIGMLAGVALALIAGRAASGLLYGITSWDPFALVAAVVLLGAVGLVASWWPARRASRVPPTVALREE